jgi:hypothetical protein
MARAARDSLRSRLAEYAEAQLKLKRQQHGAAEADWRAAYPAIRRSLAAIAKDQFSPEQWARLQEQMARRHEDRKRMIIRYLLVNLDEALVLTASQLEKLEGSLMAHWETRWEAENVLNNDGPFPAFPDPMILPFLTETQKARWKKLEKPTEPSDGTNWAVLTVEAANLAAEDAPAGDDLDAGAAVGPVTKH